ncbi:MAG: hypothetical protein AAGD92_13310 [Pseudomonadota bacterium]
MRNLTMAATIGLTLVAMGAPALANHPGKGARGGGFDRLDLNGDGEVTVDELNENQAILLQEADANADGAITREEMRAFRKAKREQLRAERNPDKNGDGVIDRLEFDQAADERFKRMDKNGDGVISEDERRRRGHRGERRGE